MKIYNKTYGKLWPVTKLTLVPNIFAQKSINTIWKLYTYFSNYFFILEMICFEGIILFVEIINQHVGR